MTFPHARVNAESAVHAVKPDGLTLCGWPVPHRGWITEDDVTCRTCAHLLATRFSEAIPA